MKTCTKCNTPQPLAEYCAAARSKDGLRHTCKACDRAYRIATAARKAETKKAWTEANKERVRAKQHEWHLRNRVSNSAKRKQETDILAATEFGGT